jgi:hypothetical protein
MCNKSSDFGMHEGGIVYESILRTLIVYVSYGVIFLGTSTDVWSTVLQPKENQ